LGFVVCGIVVETSQSTAIIYAFKSVYEFLKEIRRYLGKRKWKFFNSKKVEKMEKNYKEALMGTKNAIESCIWYGKGFAITEGCGPKVDREFHHLMGLLILRFNEIYMRLDPKKLDEKLVEHLLGQLNILQEYAQRFWNIQGISSHQDKEGDVIKIIEDFRGRLWDFTKSMEPYLKPES
jgi:hypothetical protein